MVIFSGRGSASSHHRVPNPMLVHSVCAKQPSPPNAGTSCSELIDCLMQKPKPTIFTRFRWRPPTASIVVAIVPTRHPQTTTTPTTLAAATRTTTTATTQVCHRRQEGLTIRLSPLPSPTTPIQVKVISTLLNPFESLPSFIVFNIRVEAGVEAER